MSEGLRKPAEVFHVSEFIREEMEARGWDRDRLASEMTPGASRREWGITRLTLDFLFESRGKKMFIGKKTANQLALAFGTSPELWANLDDAWRKAQ